MQALSLKKLKANLFPVLAGVICGVPSPDAEVWRWSPASLLTEHTAAIQTLASCSVSILCLLWAVRLYGIKSSRKHRQHGSLFSSVKP